MNFVIRPNLTLLAGPLLGLALTSLLPAPALGFSTGPPPQRTAVPGEANGATCTACHRGADVNSGTGRLTITARPFKGGRTQLVRVTLEDPNAMRWGFQLTARLASDVTKAAGTFRQTDAIRVQCSGGAPEGNCGGNTEFASHRQPTTFPGQRQQATWDVEWTPPADGAGEVVFYAAGNASDLSGNNQGDLVYNANARLAEESCNLTGNPRITSIKNASFSASDTSPFQRSALNTLITIGGLGFNSPGVNRAAESIDLLNARFPTELGCVAVEIGGARAPALFVNPTQINTQVPTTNQFGDVPVRVILNPDTPREIRSDAVNLNLTLHSPGFFKLLPTPCIVATFQDGSLSGDPSLFTSLPVRGAKPGDILSMYATGLGATEPVYQAGELAGEAARTRSPVTIEWNGTPMAAADVLYVGLAPGFITGVYQLNLRVPANARTNTHNQVKIRIGEELSQGDSTILVIP